MKIKVQISCVDDSYLECQTANPEFAYEFLKQNDHEGSSISIESSFHDSDCYKLLEFLVQMKKK